MIDPNEEEVISFADATKGLPRRRRGKRPHISCMYRWTTVGCKGVILESIQIGGTRCTSKQAMARFFQALTIANSPQSSPPPSSDGENSVTGLVAGFVPPPANPEKSQRFVSRAEQEWDPEPCPFTVPSPSRRRRAAESAQRELEREGL